MKQILLGLKLLPLCLCLQAGFAAAQKKVILPDSANCSPDTLKRRFLHNIFQQAWGSIQRNPDDICWTDPETVVLNARAEDFFIPFSGKILREIVINNLGFERNFSDTSRRIKTLPTRVARTLHVNTREFVIRNNLFQKEGDILDPYILADNERYLRTLDFLQDARILVRSVPGTEDSVDLYVVTKDVFSMRLVLDNDGTKAAKARVSESNFLGMGQRIQGTFLASQARNPSFGYGFEYNKNNLCGSFVHLNLAYNNIDIGPSIGYQPEISSGFNLSRPLPSPYAHYAGALNVSTNRAINSFGTPDSMWYPYAYNIFDVWGGYNLSLDHIMRSDSSIRDRKFFSARYYRQQFTDAPRQFNERFDPIYNNKEAFLGQLTFFKQNFIKTQYIYGFGITEDVPYGYNISVTGGWWKQRDLSRPYAGITVDYYTHKSNGAFCQYYLRTGGFLNEGRRVDDATFMIGASRFSRLYFSGTDFKIRQYLRGTYARIFRPLTYEPLRINNVFGLREFGTDSAQGFERISFQAETIFFTRYKWQGFRFAPFLYMDGALMRSHTERLDKASFYPGIGGGFRTRNEALIFGTIEVKACYFPRQVVGQAGFKFLIASELRYRYRTSYIHAPDIVRLNYDAW